MELFEEMINGFQGLNASIKKVFLKIPQNSQENTCARVSCLIKFNFIKILTLFSTLLKKYSGTGVFL